MKHVSRRCARALLRVYSSSFTVAWIEKLARIMPLLLSHSLRTFLENPLIEEREKAAFLEKAFKAEDLWHPMFERLVPLLAEEGQSVLVPEVLQYVAAGMYKQWRIERGSVTSTVPLTKEERQKLEDVWQLRTGTVLQASYSVDSSLIAGICVQTESLRWDASVKRLIKESITRIGG
jgi:F-type H+-transporting ATPase subunit delta